ncbi:MAG: hypothetical protein J6P16_01430, partial [Eubacterium sp.]|nr:hypothetical protein [Eubacterium sp.]
GYFYFEADKAEGLKLGDVVTYTVQGYDEEEYKKKYGVKFSQTSKEYTVEGIESYVMENTALDDAAVNIMKEATEQYIDEYFADPNRESALGVDDLKYEGYYLLTNKQSEVWFNYNKIFMVYSATVSSKEKPKAFKPAKVFFPVEYDDLKQNADGGYEVDTSYKRILGSNELTYSSWLSVSGYTSMDVMRSELVDAEGSTFEAAAYGDLA